MNLAIITGGSRGIGRALVEHHLEQGWTVLELSRSGGGAHHLTVDLAEPGAALRQVENKFDALAGQIWDNIAYINNAGLLSPVSPVHKLDDAAIAGNIAVNMTGAIQLIARFVRSFQSAPAAKVIANISSGAALKGYFGWSLYCASKAGMENFMRSLAEEQAAAAQPFVCVNIAPGIVDTAMQTEIRGVGREDFPDVGRFIQLKEAGELRRPEAVARTVFRILQDSPQNGKRYNVADYDK